MASLVIHLMQSKFSSQVAEGRLITSLRQISSLIYVIRSQLFFTTFLKTIQTERRMQRSSFQVFLLGEKKRLTKLAHITTFLAYGSSAPPDYSK